MAPRKSPDTGPHFDESGESVTDNETPRTRELPDRHFASIIRLIKTGAIGRVEQLAEVATQHVKRLKVKRGKPVKGLPDGSDHGDVRSIIVWMESIQSTDSVAKSQLGTIYSTLQQRFT